jgi:sugar lactone lactonase YvrE
MMQSFKIGAAIGIIIGVLASAPAYAWDRSKVDLLTVLPDVTPGVQSSVEGLTVGPDGNIYVPTFGFNTQGPLTGNAVLFVINPSGQVIRKVAIQNSSPHMLGLAFNPTLPFEKSLIVLDFGAGNVLQVNPLTGTSRVLAGPIPNSGLNALTFDSAGNAYVSDSFKVLRRRSARTGSSSATTTRRCTWPTQLIIRSSRFR